MIVGEPSVDKVKASLFPSSLINIVSTGDGDDDEDEEDDDGDNADDEKTTFLFSSTYGNSFERSKFPLIRYALEIAVDEADDDDDDDKAEVALTVLVNDNDDRLASIFSMRVNNNLPLHKQTGRKFS